MTNKNYIIEGKLKLIRKNISITVPASIVSDTPHLREKTFKIGLVGRAAAVFNIAEIIIYPDYPQNNQREEMNLISLLLSYMETPQYLRKRLFKLDPCLQYAGILPPLRTAHHPIEKNKKNLRISQYREGVTLKKTNEGMLIDVGIDNPVLLPNQNLEINRRITTKIVKLDDPIEVELSDRNQIQQYWGYLVTIEKQSLSKLLRKREFDLKIATSKYGDNIFSIEEKLRLKIKHAQNILIEFGSPTRGLHQIAKNEGISLEKNVDFIINTVPNQGTETIRTEEAIFATLAVLNMEYLIK